MPTTAKPSSDRAADYAEVGFRAHARAYLMVMGLLVAIWLFTTPGGYFWPMLGWGIGVISRATCKGKASGPGCGFRRPAVSTR